MALFDIFLKTPPCTDLVWLTPEAKIKGVRDQIGKNRPDLCVAWFDETRDLFHRFLNDENRMNLEIAAGYSLHPSQLEGKAALFLEHHPLYSKEEALTVKSKARMIWFASSFEDPLLALFGGKIADLMRSLGLSEYEAVESPLVSKAIRNAQKKLEKKAPRDFVVRSAAEWMDQYRMFSSREGHTFKK